MTERVGPSERTYELIAGGIGVVMLAVFGYAGYTMGDSVVIGVVAGALAGPGAYLWVPIRLGAYGGPLADDPPEMFGFDRFLLGNALSSAGVGTLAGALVFEGQPALAVAVGLALGVATYAVGTFLFGVLRDSDASSA